MGVDAAEATYTTQVIIEDFGHTNVNKNFVKMT